MLQAITTVLQAALRVKHVRRAPAKKAIKQYGTLLCNVAPSCGDTFMWGYRLASIRVS
jgi:hypothetical protein